MKQYKLEKDYTKDFLKNHLDWKWSYKIPDDSRGYKPFDIIAVIEWVPHAFELKNIKTTLTDNVLIESLSQHQIGSLVSFSNAWGKAFVYYYDNKNWLEVSKSIEELLPLIEKKYGRVKWLR